MVESGPTLKQARALASMLGSAEIANRQRSELLKAVEQLLDDHPYIGDENLRPPTRFWRGRKAGASGFDNLQQMIQPPSKSVTTFGRCHCPHQPMFYGALTVDTVFAEVSASAGEYVQTLLVVPKATCTLQLARIGEIDHWRRYRRSIDADPKVESQIQSLFPDSNWSEKQVRRMFVDAFMADMFSRERGVPGAYPVSSAIAHRYLSQGIDGIVYPSVQHRGGLNVAIHPRWAKQMDIVEVNLFQIEEDLGYGLYRRWITKQASSWDEGGCLNWAES